MKNTAKEVKKVDIQQLQQMLSAPHDDLVVVFGSEYLTPKLKKELEK